MFATNLAIPEGAAKIALFFNKGSYDYDEHLRQNQEAQQIATLPTVMFGMDLVMPKGAARLELLFNKLTNDSIWSASLKDLRSTKKSKIINGNVCHELGDA